MNGSMTLPPGIMLRDLMLSFHHSRRLILFLVVCVMALTIAIVVNMVPSYQARSSLLVLLGTEHTFRPVAGEQFMNSGGVEKEQVLRTEADILEADDLHRDVIQAIGVSTLYPKLLQPPSELSRMIGEVKTYLFTLAGAPDMARGAGAVDNVSRALMEFNGNLTVTVDRKSSVIALAFSHPDPKIAAQVLSVLEDKYLTLRARLFNDTQAPLVLKQQQDVGARLDAAEKTLADFKRDHDISNFIERRQILMRQQGDLETALTKIEATATEQQARVSELDKQLAAATGGRADAAAALQAMVGAYQKRQTDAQTTYRGSPAFDQARNDAMARQTDIANLKAKHAFEIQTERNKADAELRASNAGREAIKGQLQSISKQLASLDADETQLNQLTLARTVLEDNYKSVSKILGDRMVVENVEANRQSSVRVVEPPRPPVLPRPMRKLVLVAGVLVSMLLAVTVTLIGHFFRTIYLRPEALELDTGLPVLASVPETRRLSRGAIIVSPAG